MLSWCKDAEWCEVRKCGINKNISGCYECELEECRKGLYAKKIKPRAFVDFARRYGVEELLDCLERIEESVMRIRKRSKMDWKRFLKDLEDVMNGYVQNPR